MNDIAPAGASLPGKAVSESEVTFARSMTQLDANVLGTVHGGVIMKEVDEAAGLAASRHSGNVCVTAAIDELSFLEPVHVGDVLIVHAAVNAVGTTSIEVGVRVEAETWLTAERRHTTSAFLVMVALDREGNPAEVPPLITETTEQRRREAQAGIRRGLRMERIERLGSYRPEPGEPE